MSGKQRSAHAKQYRKWYTTRHWKTLKREQLIKQPYCEMKSCGKIASIADHRVPHRGDLVLFRDPENLQSLCKPCHDTHKQRDENRGYSGDVDKSGWPTDANHPANKGPE